MTRSILALALVLAFAFGLQGCSTSSDNTGNTATGNTTTKSTTNTSTTTPASSPASTQTASTSGSIGVPECDEYVTKYESCINQHVPEAQRAQMRATFEQARNGYKQAASTPQGKAALAQQCKQAMDMAKQATTAYGCQW